MKRRTEYRDVGPLNGGAIFLASKCISCWWRYNQDRRLWNGGMRGDCASLYITDDFGTLVPVVTF